MREVTSRDGLGAGIVGLGVKYIFRKCEGDF